MAESESPHPSVQEVRIETFDIAVNDWIDKTVDAHTEHATGDRRKVPVIFSSGERFATARTKREGIRDDQGILILPLILLRRVAIDPSPEMQALGTKTPTISFSKRIDSPKSNNLRNLNKLRPPEQRQPIVPVYEVWTIPFPSRSIISYELVIQAQYITQMNEILEKFFNQLDIQSSFCAPFENNGRHPYIGEDFESIAPITQGYCVGFLDTEKSDGGNLEEFTDQERIIRWTTTIKVPATLQLDPEGEKPAAQVTRTSFGLRFGKEGQHFVDDPYELELIFSGGKIRER